MTKVNEKRFKIIEKMYKRHFGLMMNYLMERGCDYDMAMDIIHDVIEKFLKVSHFDNANYKTNYLLVSCKYRFFDVVRDEKYKEKRHQKIKIHYFPNGEESVSLESLIISEESVENLIDFISTLPPACREATIMTILGFNHVEAAEVLGNTRSAIEKSMRRARDKLKEVEWFERE